MDKNKMSRKLRIGAAPITFLLAFILIFVNFYGENLIPWARRYEKVIEEVEDNIAFTSPLAALVRGKDRRKLETTGFACDNTETSIVCVSNQPVIIDTSNNITIYDPSIQDLQEEHIKPYALQKDTYLLQYITPVKILHGNKHSPACQLSHEAPAVIFSTGISGNIFHEFNDIIIPLFITTKHFHSKVQIILQDYDPAFVTKWSKVLIRLSRYQIMNPTVDNSKHCFPSMILGLKYHDNLALNPSEIPGLGYTMRDFRKFLQETYYLRYKHVSQIKQLKLVLISREKKRRFVNEYEMVEMMKGLGFQVIVADTKKASNLNEFANILNSCSVMVGAHGAGLTNELFLPAGAVMIQVEPLGLEWAAVTYYGNPASAMGVNYLRYKIEAKESSLVETYGTHHPVITNPESVYAKGYRVGRMVYLDQQDLRINVLRLRETLVQALGLVKNSSFAS